MGYEDKQKSYGKEYKKWLKPHMKDLKGQIQGPDNLSILYRNQALGAEAAATRNAMENARHAGLASFGMGNASPLSSALATQQGLATQRPLIEVQALEGARQGKNDAALQLQRLLSGKPSFINSSLSPYFQDEQLDIAQDSLFPPPQAGGGSSDFLQQLLSGVLTAGIGAAI